MFPTSSKTVFKVPKARDEYLTTKQRQSYDNIEGGALIIVALLPLFLLLPLFVIFHESLFSSANPANFSSTTDRLLYTLKMQAAPAFLLQLSILFVVAKRGLNPITRNPLSGHEYVVEKAVRILSNTLEQLVGFELGLFIYAVLAEDRFLYLIPAMVIVFCVGRIAFAIGYLVQPKYRIMGFVWTFLPTISLTVFNLVKWSVGVDLLVVIEKVLEAIF